MLFCCLDTELFDTLQNFLQFFILSFNALLYAVLNTLLAVVYVVEDLIFKFFCCFDVWKLNGLNAECFGAECLDAKYLF